MANPTSVSILLLVAALTLNVSFTSATSFAPPSVDCSKVVYDMMGCLDYVSDGGNVTRPPLACCSGVASVVKVSPYCLCDALSQAGAMGIAVNMTRANGLPHECKVKVPKDKCDGIVPAKSFTGPSLPPQAAESPVEPPPASPVTPSSDTHTPTSTPTSPSTGSFAVVSSTDIVLTAIVVATCYFF